MSTNLYYIQSLKHDVRVEDRALWWRPKSAGYTHDLDEAGKYSEEDAKAICSSINGTWVGGVLVLNNRMVPCRVADSLSKRSVNKTSLDFELVVEVKP